MSIEKKPTSPPKIGDLVYLPELQVWGEIVDFYDEHSQLITAVRAMVNGKPTLVEVANLMVQLADAVRGAVTLWGKIKTAAKSLCQKLGLCKPKPATVPLALTAAIKQAQKDLQALADLGVHADDLRAVNLRKAIASLQKYLPPMDK